MLADARASQRWRVVNLGTQPLLQRLVRVLALPDLLVDVLSDDPLELPQARPEAGLVAEAAGDQHAQVLADVVEPRVEEGSAVGPGCGGIPVVRVFNLHFFAEGGHFRVVEGDGGKHDLVDVRAVRGGLASTRPTYERELIEVGLPAVLAGGQERWVGVDGAFLDPVPFLGELFLRSGKFGGQKTLAVGQEWTARWLTGAV